MGSEASAGPLLAGRVREIAGNLEAIHERIARACERSGRVESEVTLIAVSKTFPASDVEAALAAGQHDFGENRVQEGMRKADSLAERGITPRWHLIGHLQSNKAAAAASTFAAIHSIDSVHVLDAVAKHRTGAGPVNVFIQVNVAGVDGQHGIGMKEVPLLIEHARASAGVILRGLMAIGPHSDNRDNIRAAFRTLRRLASAEALNELSMGMSGDFELAIEEGATHIRIGQAIFGGRT